MATRPTLPAGLDFRRSHTITGYEYNTYGRENNSKTDRLHDMRGHSTPSWNPKWGNGNDCVVSCLTK